MRPPLSVLRVGATDADSGALAAALDAVFRDVDVIDVDGADAARTRLQESTVDCVVCEAALPDADGVALAAELAAEHQTMPTVLRGPADRRSRVLEAGVIDHIPRDASAAEYRLLANRLATALGPSGAGESEAVDRAGRPGTDRSGDLLATLPDGIVGIDEDETIRRASAGTARLLGEDRETLRGATIDDLTADGRLDESFRRGYRSAVDRLTTGDAASARFEFEAVRDGQPCTLDARIAVGPDGAASTIVGTIRDVTDRASREQTLERYETLLRTMPDTVVVTDTDGRHVDVHGFEGWSGYTRPELLDEPISMTTPDEYVDRAEAVAADLIQAEDRNKATFEMDIETKDGERVPVENHMTLLPPDEDGAVPGTLSVLRDVSDRRDRERQLELYETTVESTYDGIAVIDEHGEHLLVNSVYADAIGQSRDDIEGASVEDALPTDAEWEVPENFDDLWVDAWAQAHEEGQAQFRYETTVRRADGRTVLDNRVTAMQREDGLVIYIVVGRDVTEQQNRERQIERLHRSTRELMAAESREDVAREVVAAVESTLGFPANVVRLVDDAGEHLEPVTVTDRARDMLGERSSVPIEGSPLGTAFRCGDPWLVDDLREHTDDVETDVRSLLSVPIGDVGLLTIVDDEVGVYDDSDVRLAEIVAANAESAFDRVDKAAALRERERALSRQIDRLDQFASVVSHDLRNPLNVAAGHLELLATDRPEDAHVAAIDRSLSRMASIIDDVLTLARQGDEATALEPVDLAAIADACWATVDTADASLRVDTESTIQADRSRLQQLLENLIRNGIDHVGPAVTLTVGDVPEGFYVDDDGPGIPEADREAVFETGYSTGDEGTGFGLSIVRTIAQAHGWTVACTEGSDGGARFEFTDVDVVDD